MSTKRVSIGAGELNVVDQGSGMPLLLVHGFPLDHTMWRRQIDALSDVCRVIVPDQRGFGQSGAVESLSMEGMADDLAALLDALGVAEPMVYCGLSMGGYIAWQFVKRHGDRLAKLILCDTRAAADSEEARKNRYATAEKVLEQGSAVVAAGMLPKLFADSTVAQQPDIVEQTKQVIENTAPTTVAAALHAMAARIDATSMLPDVAVATLLVCGEHDALTPAAEMRQIAAAMPSAQYVEIADAGHMAPLEKPQPVNDAIRSFLAD
ncbi:MAG: alpha/beta fold hydrolase [Pirellulaceae bacterium]